MQDTLYEDYIFGSHVPGRGTLVTELPKGNEYTDIEMEEFLGKIKRGLKCSLINRCGKFGEMK